MKINIHNLYHTDLYMVHGYDNNWQEVVCKSVKQIVVYMDIFGNLFDFATGRPLKKNTNMYGTDDIGTLFICPDELIPLSNVMSFDEIKLPKSKILQKVYPSKTKQ